MDFELQVEDNYWYILPSSQYTMSKRMCVAHKKQGNMHCCFVIEVDLLSKE